MLIPNGVDVEFHQKESHDSAVSEELSDTQGQMVGCSGLIGLRLDLEFIHRMARQGVDSWLVSVD